jgi:murein DD-endopeptidase MepM/ murein hydrolase activator NlpD
VAEPSPATGAPATGPIRPAGQVDVTELAGAAIERAEGTGTIERAGGPAAPQTGAQPVRHRVAAGETAFSIARRYGVPVAALAEWNGLGPDYTVRTGQYLLIPPRIETAAAPAPPPPGIGTPTPTPPSAAEPLPEDEAPVAATTGEGESQGPTAEALPASPDLGAERTAASGGQARLILPVAASIIRDFEPGETDGIDFAATPGAPVRAAATGTVGFITEDTAATRVILIRHADGLNTIYGNVKDPQVAVGARVGRGQLIATVGDADPAVFRFEVREGVEAVDPNDYLR